MVRIWKIGSHPKNETELREKKFMNTRYCKINVVCIPHCIAEGHETRPTKSHRGVFLMFADADRLAICK